MRAGTKLLRVVTVIASLVAVELGTADPADAVATFVVDRVDDPDLVAVPTADDCTGGANDCSLRGAMNRANTGANSGGPDVINFAIPGDGPHTIAPTTNLPIIAEAVLIDGYSQGSTTAATTDDAKENTIALAKDGTNAVIKIVISGASVVGSVDLLRIGSSATGTTIRGLALNGRNIGGSAAMEVDADGVVIEGNFIGTDAAGTGAVPNQNGIFLDAGSDGTVGGDAPNERNLISGNTFEGVTINSSNNTIEGNIIGPDKTGNAALGNGSQGVRVQGAPPGTGNSFLDNSIAFNGSVGIRLSLIDKNDAKDRDTGPNNGQNFPGLSSAVRSSDGTTTIKGKLNSKPRTVFTIQFFSNPASNPDQGKDFLGELNVRTNRFGTVSFKLLTTADIPVGDTVTATATSFTTGDTSQFSKPRTVLAST